MWDTLQAEALHHGDRGLEFSDVSDDFTLDALLQYDVLHMSNLAGGQVQYTPAEVDAIRDYLGGDHGGLLVTYLMYSGAYDHRDLSDLLGLQPDAFGFGWREVEETGTVVAAHPITANLPPNFSFANHYFEQTSPDGWTADDLLPGAEFVIRGPDESSVIAYEGGWRSVYFTALAEFSEFGETEEHKQLLYDTLLWLAGVHE